MSESLDRLETTANAHQRMMVVEVMGRHAGWIALEGGIAGSADVILLPEIPFSLENVVECIKARKAAGQREILVVVSEGARLADELVLLNEKTQGEVRLGGIGKVISKNWRRRRALKPAPASWDTSSAAVLPALTTAFWACASAVMPWSWWNAKSSATWLPSRERRWLPFPLKRP